MTDPGAAPETPRPPGSDLDIGSIDASPVPPGDAAPGDQRLDSEVAAASDSRATSPVVTAPCRRCRKPYPATEPRCPACRTKRLVDTADRLPEHVVNRSLSDLKVTLWAFAVMLISSALVGWGARLQGVAANDGAARLLVMTLLEVCDTIIVVVAFAQIRGQPESQVDTTRAIAWAVAFPALAVMLCVNFAYHAILKAIGVAVIEPPALFDDPGLAVWAVVVMCAQPALIEEWFFRGIAWRSMRSVLGPHQTVWIGAVMFGVAHTGVPLSIPVLCLTGAMLGYARHHSGGLLLPMLLHFTHNLVVILVEQLG